jgi:hypothetical protein
MNVLAFEPKELLFQEIFTVFSSVPALPPINIFAPNLDLDSLVKKNNKPF